MSKDLRKSNRKGQRRGANLWTRRPQIQNFDRLINEVLDAAIEIADADMGALYRYDDEHDCLRIAASRELSDNCLNYLAVVRRDNNNTCAAALKRRIRVAVNDVSTSDLFRGTPELDVKREFGIAAVHSTPIISASSRLWGVLTMYFRAPQQKDSYNPRLLDRLAIELADCLERLAVQRVYVKLGQVRTTATRHKSTRLAGATVPCPCHACAFFSSKDEEYRVMLPFMAEGFEAGDRLVNIIDPRDRDERVSRLKSAGVDVESAEKCGQIEMLPWERAHITEGRFDQHVMLAGLEQQEASGRDRFPAMRLWSNQEWALEGYPGVEDIAEYECRFNYVWPKTNGIYVCVYDATKFSAEIMMQMMRTHPYVILDGVIRENSLYVPPDEFLKVVRG